MKVQAQAHVEDLDVLVAFVVLKCCAVNTV